MKVLAIMVIVAIGFASVEASAEIYRYVDRGGELHYVDDIEKVPQQYRNQLDNTEPLPDVNVVDPGPTGQIRQPEPEQPRKSSVVPNAKVEVFVTSWCGYCKKMERFLTEKGIEYIRYDIEKDEAAAREYRQIGGRGVPVVRIGDSLIHGFNPEAVMSYLTGGVQ